MAARARVMTGSSFVGRIDAVQEALLAIVANDRSHAARMSDAADEPDAITYGINVLVKVLDGHVAERRCLKDDLDRVVINLSEGLAVIHLLGQVVDGQRPVGSPRGPTCRLGTEAFLAKPFLSGEVLARVRALLRASDD